MKRNIVFLLVLSIFVLGSLFQEGAQKTYIKSGKSSFGDEIANLDGKNIREGKNSYGDVIANIDGNYIREGKNSFGDIIANIDGNYIREGKSSYGDILFNIDGSATTMEKGALAAAALRLAGRL